MLKNTLTALQEDKAREVLRKLSELSPEKRETALAMCGFFIDGMNAQERLMSSMKNNAQDSA